MPSVVWVVIVMNTVTIDIVIAIDIVTTKRLAYAVRVCAGRLMKLVLLVMLVLMLVMLVLVLLWWRSRRLLIMRWIIMVQRRRGAGIRRIT